MFAVEYPNRWTTEDLLRYMQDTFGDDNCGRHPHSAIEHMEVPLNKALLDGMLDDPGDPEDRPDPKLPVYKPRSGWHLANTGGLTPAQLKVLGAWSPETTVGAIAASLTLKPGTVQTTLAKVRESLGAASTPEAQEIAREKGWLK
ncbi:hypothetical protein A3A14_02855 [Candidatus Daviesbacteria bacterium RIFCSPLOWO2_01_FULL_43_38]|nr:MAG: hypothetical protein A2874_03440 [Candidatus Daviesbacteria bacterium RIFCSPHIGHO2_01_FULL_43_17]OGE63569.1 MAG: hypothetical protein A3A14_02855 [Candidatus Daviesbacteria bacterium RIFCSPLOWO2_01_FULL_43_38]OGE69188.1 MAG: hypothetical protein A3J21_01540 [Candidatus Daviesbacteria bacterium RIFCSPLOWO2_02_FULL_43_11]